MKAFLLTPPGIIQLDTEAEISMAPCTYKLGTMHLKVLEQICPNVPNVP